MLLSLLIGIPVMILCLVLQAAVLIICIRHYAGFKSLHLQGNSPYIDTLVLALLMLMMLLGNFLQMASWAALFMLIGEFDSFDTALYFSAVNYSTLGYGDIVMTPDWRLLGPLESANGILMFGVTTAAMTAAVMDVLKRNMRNQAN